MYRWRTVVGLGPLIVTPEMQLTVGTRVSHLRVGRLLDFDQPPPPSHKHNGHVRRHTIAAGNSGFLTMSHQERRFRVVVFITGVS